jgi:hypothetical protein
MPWHWYISSALPRALLGALPLAALGCVLERRVGSWLACVVLYIAAYSLLPHKEVQALMGAPPADAWLSHVNPTVSCTAAWPCSLFLCNCNHCCYHPHATFMLSTCKRGQ